MNGNVHEIRRKQFSPLHLDLSLLSHIFAVRYCYQASLFASLDPAVDGTSIECAALWTVMEMEPRSHRIYVENWWK
jgi:hypothetical protein